MPASELSRDGRVPSLDELCDKGAGLQIAGRLDLAEGIYREILRAQPLHAAANYCFGILLVHVKRPGDGLPHLLAALSASPRIPDYWLGCLEALLLLDKIDEAGQLLASARQNAIVGAALDEFAQRLAAKRPASAPPLPAATKFGAPADIKPKNSAPAPGSRRVKTLSPRQQEKQLNELIGQTRFLEALALARQLTEHYPERGLGWKVAGALLWAEGDQENALAAMRTAVRLMPQNAEGLRNLGSVLIKTESFEESERYLRRSLHIGPASVALLTDLGNCCISLGRNAEGQALYRRAIALSADGPATTDSDWAHTNLLMALSHDPAVDADSLFAEHCRIGEHIEGRAREFWPHHTNDPDPARRLQVGFVSGDFCNHAVATFIEPVLAQLQNSPALELHAYYNNDQTDAVTQRLRGYMQHWRQVRPLSAQQLAEQIMADKIDILIDLSGHTSLNRLHAFARKPAPVQVSWIGYPGTTGLTAMDYYLTDRHWLPPGEFDKYFTERLVYACCGALFQPHPAAPPIEELPALRTGHLSFGSFNRMAKVNSATISLWSRLLCALPDATILIAGIAMESSQVNLLLEQFAAEGVAPARVKFHPRCKMDAYLALHHEVDICLDTAPYSGGTTTYHALWMGVPTLTVAGPTPASRQGAAIMAQLGLDQFIARDTADFVAKGVYWAGQLPALATVRAGLRDQWAQSPDRSARQVAVTIERALRHMWGRWCNGLPAESFEVAIPESIN
jgi:predicted O-linked N-acetylglucosamine transferase (SPINDLY family)